MILALSAWCLNPVARYTMAGKLSVVLLGMLLG